MCLICGGTFQREVKPDGRKKLGCGECGETPELKAKSIFLYKKAQTDGIKHQIYSARQV